MQIGAAEIAQSKRKPLIASAALILLVVLLIASGQFGVLAISTLISEDLTCLAAGQLIRRGDMSAFVGVFACTFGIFVGDMGLWLVGRLVVRRVIDWPWLTKLVSRRRVIGAKQWFDDRFGRAVLVSRFVPGMRLPIYLAMGASGVDGFRFAFWSFIAALVWTPLLVLLVAHAGDLVVDPIEAYIGAGWLSLLAAIAVGFGVIRAGIMLLTEIGRARLVASISRLWRWEFWPSCVFYAPVVPWIAWLSLRHCGFTTITAANPGIPHGGFVGESKFDILSSLDQRHVIPTALIRAAEFADRLARFDRIVNECGWAFPLILKPDAGQRGAGVRLARCRDDAAEYLRTNESPVIVQPFHPGPHEAGIFYYRLPNEHRGRIMSITDKHFSTLVGDGVSTVEQLIWRNPRYRMQASVFLQRHAADAHRVLLKRERLSLAIAGNHCQGTMFRDGARLLTAQLEAKIDEIARSFDGFFFGRFDVRYSDVDQFRAGEDLTIIELNGVTSESTNLYDPSWSLWRAYRQLFTQWSILFRIGAANRSQAHPPSTLRALLHDTLAFYRNRQANALAD